jgi:hypothetical protein
MSTRDQLHDLIDVLDDERADELLAELESEWQRAEPRPLTELELARLRKSVAQAKAGPGISSDEVRRRLGIAD